MTRTPLALRILPPYTRREDMANMITHIVGGALGLVVLVLSLIKTALARDAWGMVSSCLFGGTMIALYSISSIYHGLRPGMAKKVMQVIDHCTIYFLIAGTYAPILLCAIRPEHSALAWAIFGAQWALVAFASTLNAVDLNAYKKLSMACYIVMGWCIVIAVKTTIQTMTLPGFLWLLAGGLSYTLGAVLYALGKKNLIFHTVFHVFVVIGSALQAGAIYFYVI